MPPTLAAGVVGWLGAAPETVFARWEDLPVAAASIGQVHRATTQRVGGGGQGPVPGVAEAIEEDLDGAEVMYTVFSALALNGLDAVVWSTSCAPACARSWTNPRGAQRR